LDALKAGSTAISRLGIALPHIVRYFPTELPRLDLHLQQVDSVFLLEDAPLLHLEFQASYLWEDLIRFAEYDLGLHRQHRCDVVTAIFYGPAVTRRPPPCTCAPSTSGRTSCSWASGAAHKPCAGYGHRCGAGCP
jgi:hypothetical protein